MTNIGLRHLRLVVAVAEQLRALIEATVRRSRTVALTAAAAMLAFVPLTSSSFWRPLAFALIGVVGVGTILTLLFLPALYALFSKGLAQRPPTTSRRSKDRCALKMIERE